MTPPGLGFVFFNDRAARARDRAGCVTHHWDWRLRARPESFYQHFDGTAPTHHLYGLRAALDMIAEEGLEAVWARHAALSRAIWAAFEAWGSEGPVELNVARPRSAQPLRHRGAHRRPHGERAAALAGGKYRRDTRDRSGHGRA